MGFCNKRTFVIRSGRLGLPKGFSIEYQSGSVPNNLVFKRKCRRKVQLAEYNIFSWAAGHCLTD